MEFSFQYGVLLTLEPSDALLDKNYSVASEGNTYYRTPVS